MAGHPNDPVVLGQYAIHLAAQGRFREALEHIGKAVQLDPLSPGQHAQHGVVSYFSRRMDEAEAHHRAALRLAPDHSVAHWGLWGIFHSQRRFDQALQEAKAYFTAVRDSTVVAALETGHAAGGYSAALRRAAEVLVERSRTRHVRPMWVFALYMRIGERDLALDWLERAVEERDRDVRHIAVLLTADPIRDHPRYQAILRRVNLATVSAAGPRR